MLRWFQALLCMGALFVVSGCKPEVKEISAKSDDVTPKVSDEKRQKEMDAEKKRDEATAKARADQKKNAGKNKKKKKK